MRPCRTPDLGVGSGDWMGTRGCGGGRGVPLGHITEGNEDSGESWTPLRARSPFSWLSDLNFLFRKAGMQPPPAGAAGWSEHTWAWGFLVHAVGAPGALGGG